MEPVTAPGPVDAADEAQRRRARRVLWLSGTGAALVMGGLVALALFGPDDAEPARRLPVEVGHASPTLPVGAPLPVGCLPDPERPPRLEADLPATGLDFGAVKQGQVIHRDVTMRNAGQGPLCIRQIVTGCGCIKAEIKGEQRRFETGESFTVVVTLDSTGRSGQQKKALTVTTNELEHSQRTWPITADVSLGVIASSNALDFGRPRRGAPAEATLRLSSPKTDAPWTVTDLVPGRVPGQEPPAFVWSATEVADPALRIVEVKVTHPGRREDGMWQGAVVLKTSHPDRPEIHLIAHLTILPPVQATPPAAIFGFVKNGNAEQPQKIMLRAGPGVTFQVKDIRVEPAKGREASPDGPGFVAERGTAPDGTPFVSVRYDGRDRRPGLVEAVLVVAIDLAEQPEVRVSLKATVAAGTAGR
jgi:hypothetical protein